jgi:hypothetical protein
MGLLPRGFLCSACCAFALGLPFHLLAQEQKTTSADPQQAATITENGASASLALAELPDSPGAEWAKSQPASSQQAGATEEGSSQPNAQATPQPQASGSQDQKLQHPVGTAAAEAPKVNGITAAQPAGVALAPAKQRRVRTIALKVGAIIGAGAALGAVIALTEATPSKPPGAH